MTRWKSAIRSLARRPAFSIATVLILTLGIGGTTALFSLINTVLWKPLPYPEPDRLVAVLEANPAKSQNASLMAPVRIEDWNRLSQSFDAISGYYSESVTETSGAEPVRLSGLRVAPRFFAVYNMPPLLGRWPSPNEEKFGGPAVAVISYGVWTGRYHQDPQVIGRRLVIGGNGVTIIAVMPADFAPPATEIWMPAQVFPELTRQRDARFLSGVGRMKPGVTPRQAQADLARVQAGLGEQYPKTDQGWSAMVTDLREWRVGSQRTSLYVMFAATMLLLLIACANAGGLMLGQLHRREKEIAIRSSLGASRMQIVSVILREVALLVAGGALLGILLAAWCIQTMRVLFKDTPRIHQLHLDWRAVAFTISASLLSAAIFGLIPAIETLRAELRSQLAQTSRSQVGGRRLLQEGLVAAQFAVTLVLLLGAGLLIRSYAKLTQVPQGFDSSHVVTFHVGAAWNENRPAVGRMQVQILSDLSRVPGIQAAGFTNFLPASEASLRYEFQLEGVSEDQNSGKVQVGERTIGGDYLQALRVRILEGQGCPALQADLSKPSQAIVNQKFVEKYANSEPILGRHIRLGSGSWEKASPIIGVVGDAKEDRLGAADYPYLYLCSPAGNWPDPEYVVRTAGDPGAVIGAIRTVIREAAPNRAIFGMTRLDTVIDSSIDKPRMNAEVVGLFAATALLLAAVGLYSLVMLSVTSRTREIGLRTALGANPSRIVSSIVGEAARPVLAGLVAGAILAVAALKVLRSVLFGVGLTDGVALASVAGVLVLVSILAAVGPARRAAAIDPIVALRED